VTNQQCDDMAYHNMHLSVVSEMHKNTTDIPHITICMYVMSGTHTPCFIRLINPELRLLLLSSADLQCTVQKTKINNLLNCYSLNGKLVVCSECKTSIPVHNVMSHFKIPTRCTLISL